MRLALLSAALSGLEVILPLFVDSMPRNVFAVLAFCTAIGATIARIMAQPKMERRAKPRPPMDTRNMDFEVVRRRND